MATAIVPSRNLGHSGEQTVSNLNSAVMTAVNAYAKNRAEFYQKRMAELAIAYYGAQAVYNTKASWRSLTRAYPRGRIDPATPDLPSGLIGRKVRMKQVGTDLYGVVVPDEMLYWDHPIHRRVWFFKTSKFGRTVQNTTRNSTTVSNPGIERWHKFRQWQSENTPQPSKPFIDLNKGEAETGVLKKARITRAQSELVFRDIQEQLNRDSKLFGKKRVSINTFAGLSNKEFEARVGKDIASGMTKTDMGNRVIREYVYYLRSKAKNNASYPRK
jgi:hypothetical protein